MRKDITIKDIATIAGVSHSTVSRALNDSPLISIKTKKRINEICLSSGYSVNYIARSLVNKHSDLIGVILPSLNNPFMAELANLIEFYSHIYKYNILICNSSEDGKREEEAFSILYERQVDGMVVFPVNTTSVACINKLNKKKIPTLFINDPVENEEGIHIAVNNINGGKIGVDYLFSVGHKNLLFFSPNPVRASQIRRQEGYCQSCMEHGIEPNLLHQIISIEEIYHINSTLCDIDIGYELAKVIFDEKLYKNYSAIFARTDMMALGIVKAANERNILIPKDLSLMGYDDISYSSLPGIELTTVRQPVELLAEEGIDRLVRAMRGEKVEVLHKYLEPELKIRKTCLSI